LSKQLPYIPGFTFEVNGFESVAILTAKNTRLLQSGGFYGLGNDLDGAFVGTIVMSNTNLLNLYVLDVKE